MTRRARLRVALTVLGWTQHDLARAAGCNVASVQRWQARGDGVPAHLSEGREPVTTARLAAALGLPVEALTPGSRLVPGFADADSVVVPKG